MDDGRRNNKGRAARQSYELGTKIDCIRMRDNGKSILEISNQLHIPRSCIQKWVRNEKHKILHKSSRLETDKDLHKNLIEVLYSDPPKRMHSSMSRCSDDNSIDSPLQLALSNDDGLLKEFCPAEITKAHDSADKIDAINNSLTTPIAQQPDLTAIPAPVTRNQHSRSRFSNHRSKNSRLVDLMTCGANSKKRRLAVLTADTAADDSNSEDDDMILQVLKGNKVVM